MTHSDARRPPDRIAHVDDAIRNHLSEQSPGDEPAPISVNDKWSWAKSLQVDLDLIDQRLEHLCRRAEPQDEHDTVPRYRLK